MDQIFTYGMLWLTSFVSVFLLGSQSKNVQHSRYLAAAITSFGIAGTQLCFVRISVIGDPLTTLLVSGSAGSLGICAAIFIFDFMRRRHAGKETA
ncbi:hypothetical protein [Magnetospirillum molischianum]|uniref:Uncharacterized protein n=1 Tax=Magnetospirillum molischianum DSM 120 TaxID=1150626 RepID=H8FY37_MAGML|nr:hypothetical protein [Magnetospirillum molischianum]CCG43275.1 membrane hypothetical protein [Magnetospirillum molischianum DSM 120]